jgi:signal peptidase II
VVAAATTVVCDQISKLMALATLSPGERVDLLGTFFGLRLVRNSGGAFSILQDRSGLLAAATAVVIVIVAIWAARSGEFPLPFGLIVGGGIGNLADRVFRAPGFPDGKVVDFIDFSFWPTFNLADTAITIGVGLLLIRSLQSGRRQD